MKSQESGPSEPPEPSDPDPGPGMPEPDALSFRRERFCQAYARHGNAARAAREAGYAPGFAKQRGHKLLNTAPVRARIEAIAAALDSEAADDPKELIRKLEIVYRRALKSRAFHAAARAVELQARLGRRLACLPATGAPPPASTEEEPDLDALIAGAEATLGRIDADASDETDNGGAA